MGGDNLMFDNQRTIQIKVLSGISYVLGLLLFFEWIRPLDHIVGFDHLNLFILFATFSFAVMLFNLPSWVAALIKTTTILLVVHFTFLPRPVLSDHWWSVIQFEFQQNATATLARNWFQFTEIFQTIIFLVIIALVSYLLYFWFVTMRRVLIYICLTLVYVTVMDTFTAYKADRAIIWIATISVFILVINHYLRKTIDKQLPIHFSNWFFRIIAPLTFIMLAIGSMSYFAPKSDPIWPDPVPFVMHVSERFTDTGKSGELGRSGYSLDDSSLGGSLMMDDTPIFYAETPIEHYWRIESKDHYTGKGWQRNTHLNFERYRAGDLQLVESWLENDLTRATVEYTEQVNSLNLVYPYGVAEVNQELTDFFEYDGETGQINPIFPNQILQTFELLYSHPVEMTYYYPNVSYQQLRDAGGTIPHQIASTYLQLPETLPDRVIQLAADIIDGEETQYDQTVAIERYFSRGNFRYQIDDVPYPAEGQDYVDQFLFETQYGYCDNFSTSMVVLLRAVGIPARWVKGFSSGEQIEDLSTDDQALYRYEIKNSNAHSWVEVYFPEIGWIPFEPTIGFSGSDMLYNENKQVDDQYVDKQEQPRTEEDHEMLQEDQALDQDPIANEQTTGRSLGDFSIWFWLSGIIVSVLIVGLIAIKWKQFLTKLILSYWSSFESKREFETAYLSLVKLLRLHQLKRRPDQTLNSFAREVDETLQTDLMTRLTNTYTQLIYRKDFQLENKSDLYDDYQALIKRILT